MTIFQWNVLADSHATKEGFPYVSEDCLDVQKRHEKQFSIIRTRRPTFVTLQEIDDPEHFIKFFRETDYSYTYYPRSHSSLGLIIACNQASGYTMDSVVCLPFKNGNQNALIITITFADGETCLLATTHLKAGVDNTELRTLQSEELSAYINKERKNHNYFIVTGDFNYHEGESFLQEHWFNNNFKSAYPLHLVTTCKARENGVKLSTEDFILLSTNCQIEYYESLAYTKENIPYPYLPSQNIPSDHMWLHISLNFS